MKLMTYNIFKGAVKTFARITEVVNQETPDPDLIIKRPAA
jgi:hypothetical protein